jgi:ribosomal protein S18 acetylase RimI-like enzyme
MLEIRNALFGEIEFLRTLDTMAVVGSERHGQIAMWVTNGVCRTALLDGEIVGYSISTYSFFHQRFIELVLVAKAYRRQGIGLSLLRDALKRLPEEKVWTSTNKSNSPMQALLAKAGFIESGRVDNLDPGDPELVFVHLPTVTPVDCAVT